MEHLSIVPGRITQKVVEAPVVEFAQRTSNGGTVCPVFLILEKTPDVTLLLCGIPDAYGSGKTPEKD